MTSAPSQREQELIMFQSTKAFGGFAVDDMSALQER
jgi:hypothetical protein